VQADARATAEMVLRIVMSDLQCFLLDPRVSSRDTGQTTSSAAYSKHCQKNRLAVFRAQRRATRGDTGSINVDACVE
jgi:hypothetical protein